ncbi:hypothetical protein M758_8G122900 [Ceratodon purpureus]|nr:hypothetical protein M758_8G122900 [Ceratodon purpureus]
MESKKNFLRRWLGWEHDRELNEKKLKEPVSAVVSSTREMADYLRCLSSASVVCCRCCIPSLHTTSSSTTSIELDGAMKQSFGQNLGLSSIDVGDGDDGKMKMTPLEYFEPDRVANLRNGSVPTIGAQPRSGWMSKGFAILRYGWVSMGVSLHKVFGRLPKVIASLRKKSQRETLPDASTSGNGDGTDPSKSLLVILSPAASQLPAQDIIDAAIDSVQVRVPEHAVIVEVVAEEAVDVVDVGDDGLEVVLDVVDVVRATVNLGVEGAPIELGVFSPTEFTNLIFNVLLPLPMVDGVHQ